MEPRIIASGAAFVMALIFLITGIMSLFTGKIYMKNQDSHVDKVHGAFVFYTSIIFQFGFAAFLFAAAHRWYYGTQ
jgi:hypothetical protein